MVSRAPGASVCCWRGRCLGTAGRVQGLGRESSRAMWSSLPSKDLKSQCVAWDGIDSSARKRAFTPLGDICAARVEHRPLIRPLSYSLFIFVFYMQDIAMCLALIGSAYNHFILNTPVFGWATLKVMFHIY